jgi:hypothetical protein
MNMIARATAFASAFTAAAENYFRPCGNLERDGYCVVASRNTRNSLESSVLAHLPAGYHFLNYKYIIGGQPLITYHRDVTSSQTSFNTKHPTYTAIHYNYAGEHLSVAPGSHLSWTLGLPITLGGKENTVILFNADLVHGGVDAPEGVARVATQYKIAHLDDFEALDHLQGVNMTVERTESLDEPMNTILRLLSYVFTVPIQVFARSLLQERQPGLVGYLQSLFPLQYFNRA